VTSGIPGILGGLGLFLIGMTIMTGGLRDLAGRSLRHALARFTRSPLTGAVTGTISTALIQSSSATTVMAIGFVSAGLLTFSQSLGILFGANIGTTITGWLIALLGFKLSLTDAVMPLVFAGAWMRLLGRRRVRAAGSALAGFGLVFAGIALLQSGLEGFRDVVTPETFPPDTVPGRLFLVGIGVAITLVTQSSSAGVATAIAAVHVGNISLAQAAAMVIGMDVGTTVTAVIASLGGGVGARRTGLAHVLYNLMTGVGAFLLLPFFLQGVDALLPVTLRSDPELVLVAFHSTFNAIGVVIVLPFTAAFARLIERLVSEHDDVLVRRLEPSLLSHAPVAVDAVRATLDDLVRLAFGIVHRELEGGSDTEPDLDRLQAAVTRTRSYLGDIRTDGADPPTRAWRLAELHAIDHLGRLASRCAMRHRARTVRETPELAAIAASLTRAMRELEELTDDPLDSATRAATDRLAAVWRGLEDRSEPYRHRVLRQSEGGGIEAADALGRLDAIRWLRRVTYHAWRILHHRTTPAESLGPEDPEDTEIDGSNRRGDGSSESDPANRFRSRRHPPSGRPGPTP